MGVPGIEEAARSGQRSSLNVDSSIVSRALSSQYSQDSTKRMLRDGARYGQADLPSLHQVSGTLGLAVMAGPDADVSSLLQAPTSKEHGKWMQRDMRVTRVYAGTLAREPNRLALVISEARASSCFGRQTFSSSWVRKMSCSSTMIWRVFQRRGMRDSQHRHNSGRSLQNVTTIKCWLLLIALLHSIILRCSALVDALQLLSRKRRPSRMKCDFIRPLRACDSPTALHIAANVCFRGRAISVHNHVCSSRPTKGASTMQPSCWAVDAR